MFFSAYNYTIFGKAVQIINPTYSALSARWVSDCVETICTSRAQPPALRLNVVLLPLFSPCPSPSQKHFVIIVLVSDLRHLTMYDYHPTIYLQLHCVFQNHFPPYASRPHVAPTTHTQFLRIFLTADILCLVLQAIGGGWAASVTPAPKPATDLMLAGIALQLGIMIIFLFLGIDYCIRAKLDRPYKGKVNSMRRLNSSPAGLGGADMEMQMAPVGTSSTDATPLRQSKASPSSSVAMGRWEGMNRGWWLMMLGMGISSVCIIIRGKWQDHKALSVSTIILYCCPPQRRHTKGDANHRLLSNRRALARLGRQDYPDP